MSIPTNAMICNKCSAKVVNGWNCISCDSHYHPSCAKKLRNAKIVTDNTILCCEKPIENNGLESDLAFFDAVEEYSNKDKKIDFNIFTYIIRQKDVIINELNDKIRILNEHINLLKKHQSNITEESCDKDKTKTKANAKIRSENGAVNNQNKTQSSKTDKDVPYSTVTKDKMSIGKADVALAINQVENQLLLDSIINLPKADENKRQNQPSKNMSDGNAEKIQSRVDSASQKKKPKRQVIFGNNRDMASVGVPKFVSLHVYRLEPEITVEKLAELMKPHFPEMKCESLLSRHPSIYSSFKISIFANNFAKAMDANLWPYGACVSRFFSKREDHSRKK